MMKRLVLSLLVLVMATPGLHAAQAARQERAARFVAAAEQRIAAAQVAQLNAAPVAAAGLPAVFLDAPVLDHAVAAPQAPVQAESAVAVPAPAQTAGAKRRRGDAGPSENCFVVAAPALGGGAAPASAVVMETCVICQEDFDPAVTAHKKHTCEKSFHNDCIARWHGVTKNCPNCRVTWNTRPAPPSQPQLGLSLLVSINTGNVAQTVAMIHAGNDVNIRDHLGQTALMRAAFFGNTQIVALLLADQRTDVNARDERGNTALMIAAFYGDADVVALLLADPRTDVNARDNDGNTALTFAAFYGYVAIVTALLAHPRTTADTINTRIQQNKTPLVLAAAKGHAAIVAALLADPRLDAEQIGTARECAEHNGHAAVVRLLDAHIARNSWCTIS